MHALSPAAELLLRVKGSGRASLEGLGVRGCAARRRAPLPPSHSPIRVCAPAFYGISQAGVLLTFLYGDAIFFTTTCCTGSSCAHACVFLIANKALLLLLFLRVILPIPAKSHLSRASCHEPRMAARISSSLARMAARCREISSSRSRSRAASCSSSAARHLLRAHPAHHAVISSVCEQSSLGSDRLAVILSNLHCTLTSLPPPLM